MVLIPNTSLHTVYNHCELLPVCTQYITSASSCQYTAGPAFPGLAASKGAQPPELINAGVADCRRRSMGSSTRRACTQTAGSVGTRQLVLTSEVCCLPQATFYGQQQAQDSYADCSLSENYANVNHLPWTTGVSTTLALNGIQFADSAACGLCVMYRGAHSCLVPGVRGVAPDAKREPGSKWGRCRPMSQISAVPRMPDYRADLAGAPVWPGCVVGPQAQSMKESSCGVCMPIAHMSLAGRRHWRRAGHHAALYHHLGHGLCEQQARACLAAALGAWHASHTGVS